MIKNDYCYEPVAEINLKNLYHNISFIKDNLDKKQKLICVVKSDAYGHGIEIAKYMEKYADAFAVSKVAEGVKLRYLGITKPIIMLTVIGSDDVCVAINYNITILVENLNYLNFLLSNFNREILVNLKVDSGMRRLGFDDLNYFETALKTIAKSKKVRLCGVYSHFFNSSSYRDCKMQFKEFYKYLTLFDKFFDGDRHISASGGFLHKKFNLDAVRIGILLYGYSPNGENLPIKPIMKIYAESIKDSAFLSGEKCLYNCDVKSGDYSLVNYGYADGLFRNGNPNRCMDLSLVKSNGGKAVIFDDANYLAKKNNTIPYEILVNSTKRIKKIYLGDI